MKNHGVRAIRGDGPFPAAMLSASRVCFGVAAGACLAAAACGGGGGAPSAFAPGHPISSSPTPTPDLQKIQHIIIVVQENRTTDNLFNGFPGANTVRSGLSHTGVEIPLQPIPLEVNYDLGHVHESFLADYNFGAMNGFDSERAIPYPGYSPQANPAFGYVPQSETQPYFQMGERFTFADEMFQTNQGPSFPAHQYLISGTSIPEVGSDLLVSEDVFKYGNSGHNGGCDAPPGAYTYLIDHAGNETQQIFPCFEHQTLVDLLDAKGISWTYYSPRKYFLWEGLDAIRHSRYGPDWTHVVVPETTIFNDIASGNLATVSWVIPTNVNSDHSASGSNAGPSWVASIVNAIGGSQYWGSTAIFVTWDDWGGWYDHVKPPIYDSYEDGFRVPLLVVSPYARAGYVSHVPHEFGSILKFVEERFALGTLGYTDARSDDLLDCFNFSQPPIPFLTIEAPYSRSYLLAHWRYGPPDSD